MSHDHSHCQIVSADYVIPDGPEGLFDNPAAIERRAEAVPAAHQSIVRRALRYMFLTDGPKNSPLHRLKEQRAQELVQLTEHLSKAELLLFRYLKNRTNNGLRATYGAAALRQAQAARFRCQDCRMPDVRTLHLDHVNGRQHDTTTFRLLCANCHNIKSRMSDWHGGKSQPVDALLLALETDAS